MGGILISLLILGLLSIFLCPNCSIPNRGLKFIRNFALIFFILFVLCLNFITVLIFLTQIGQFVPGLFLENFSFWFFSLVSVYSYYWKVVKKKPIFKPLNYKLIQQNDKDDQEGQLENKEKNIEVKKKIDYSDIVKVHPLHSDKMKKMEVEIKDLILKDPKPKCHKPIVEVQIFDKINSNENDSNEFEEK